MIRVLPWLLRLFIWLMPAMVPSERSSGVATVAAMICGLAPGRLACTVMVGKSICGNGATDSFGGAVEAVHAGVLPLDGDRSGVADVLQRAEGVLPGDVPVAGGDEVPAAARVTPRQMGAQDAVAAVEHPDRLLDVHVEDAVGIGVDEIDRVDHLPVEMAGVEVDAHRRVVDVLEALNLTDDVRDGILCHSGRAPVPREADSVD